MVALPSLQRLTFSPYTQRQLQQIIRSRLTDGGSDGAPGAAAGGGGGAFDQKSLEYASRKVAAVSGDVRRALELCRRAVEMTIERGGTQQVGIGDVNAAVQELSFSPHIRVITSSPVHHRVMLAAIVMEMRFTGVATLGFTGVAERHRDICRTKGYFDRNGAGEGGGGGPAPAEGPAEGRRATGRRRWWCRRSRSWARCSRSSRRTSWSSWSTWATTACSASS